MSGTLETLHHIGVQRSLDRRSSLHHWKGLQANQSNDIHRFSVRLTHDFLAVPDFVEGKKGMQHKRVSFSALQYRIIENIHLFSILNLMQNSVENKRHF
jgi:hypothetical protein